ncbi:mRNA cap guanine-N7 methyltransferase [Condylostylus longicornis]|uniref:mRNA cap guanine-N7 methyltransferase n=1 Tax=Condylostylus longicornis TaxID=2530218 RepID=UPI00244E1D75|nr:mRNA cap guanine-N7 methyltransferase [Condylostylus longicornis]
MSSDTHGELNLSDDDNDDTGREDNAGEIYYDQSVESETQYQTPDYSDNEGSSQTQEPKILKRKHEPSSNQDNAEKYQKVNENAKVVATHYNKLEEKGLAKRSKSKIIYMRNFNNWIKSMLIEEYLKKIKSTQKLGEPLRVLDMCCGKGGDLFKWEKGGITHLICTDIAEVSVEQCQQRYNAIISRADKKFGSKKFTAEFFACDSTLERLREKYKDPSMKLNLVSCQFAFHYCFESLTQAEIMVRNAAECLLPGGYFIATIPDANEIMRRQRLYGRKFGNSVYNIDFICDTERPPLFGAKYKFYLEDVVDCPEFLVHFPTFEKLCRKNGLKLEMKSSFADYYKKNIEHGKGLLQRMQALESYPPPRNGSLVGQGEDEYAHCKKYLSSNYGRQKTVGTLSKSEWETTTLYLVCTFKKCKNTWDSEGKPVFEWD